MFFIFIVIALVLNVTVENSLDTELSSACLVLIIAIVSDGQLFFLFSDQRY